MKKAAKFFGGLTFAVSMLGCGPATYQTIHVWIMGQSPEHWLLFGLLTGGAFLTVSLLILAAHILFGSRQ